MALYQFEKSKSILNYFFFLFCTLGFNSCGLKDDPVNMASDHNAKEFTKGDEVIVSNFIVSVGDILLQEIQLAKLAQLNSIEKDVQLLGKQMEVQYKEGYEALKQLAIKKSIALPLSLSTVKQKSYADISNEVLDNFDRKYFDLVEIEHKDIIEICEKIKKEANDDEIKVWAENMLPTFRNNLGTIVVIHQKLVEGKKANGKKWNQQFI